MDYSTPTPSLTKWLVCMLILDVSTLLSTIAQAHKFLPSTRYVEMLLNLTHRAYIILVRGFKMGIFTSSNLWCNISQILPPMTQYGLSLAIQTGKFTIAPQGSDDYYKCWLVGFKNSLTHGKASQLSCPSYLPTTLGLFLVYHMVPGEVAIG